MHKESIVRARPQKLLLTGSVFLVCAIAVGAPKVNFRNPVIVPAPVRMECVNDVAVKLDDTLEINVVCPEDGAGVWLSRWVKKCFSVEPEIRQIHERPAGVEHPEGYSIAAQPEKISISAKSLQGVRHAFHTLRQAAEPIPEGREIRGWWLPEMHVQDAPALNFRGVHICCFPETTAAFLERAIRIAAYYKFNYAVIESWGMFKSRRFPWLAVKDSWLTAGEATRLAELGRDLGIVLIPQFNIFGHATGSTFGSGKHVTLDFHPEFSPMFEPGGGWNWCLTNPETLEVQKEYLAEIHQAFLNPPFVHVGCDEGNRPSCARCRAAGSYERIFVDHVVSVADALRKRGARIMVWHDMLLDGNDARWQGFYANGTRETAELLASVFPKDAVVCDWYYGKIPENGDYPTLRHFKKNGFDTLTCPWKVEGVEGSIAAQGRFAREEKLFGFLQTTWGVFKGQWFGIMMEEGACAAWGTEHTHPYAPVKFGSSMEPRPFAAHWRQCGWDMGTPEYSETGYSQRQMSRNVSP